MARTFGSNGAKTVESLKKEATRLIYEHGFEGMNLRMLAEAVGIQPGSLYNHISNKQDLLHILLNDVMEELLEGVEAALMGSATPRDALMRFIAFHIQFHAERKEDVFIGNAELRSLEPANFKAIAAKREKYETYLNDIFDAGTRQGQFHIADTKVATYATIAMLTGVCTWYRPGGRHSIGSLVEIYTSMVMNGIDNPGQAPEPVPARKATRPRKG